MNYRAWMLWVLLPACFGLSGMQRAVAQADTLIRLRAATVVADRFELDAGTKTHSPDSLQLMQFTDQNLSDLLVNENRIYLKTYGASGLATTSWRGAGAGRTAILWNGFNLQSPMNGTVDLSLLPTILVDEVSLTYGGQGALYGSGAIGGAVQLNNQAVFDQGFRLKLNAGAGSFGAQNLGLQTGWSGQKVSAQVRAYRQHVDNDYPFQPANPNLPETNLTNSERTQQGILAEVHAKLSPRQLLDVYWWRQETDREIPPTLFEAASEATQVDQFDRLAVRWSRYGDKAQWLARAALLDEQLEYDDPRIETTSENRTQAFITELEYRRSWADNLELVAGLHQQYNRAEADNFTDKPDQWRKAAFALLNWITPLDRVKTTLSLRQEQVDDTFNPLTPSLGITVMARPWLDVQAKGARTYRVPTLNDQYWIPGGNPDLNAESGWSGELGLMAKSNTEKPWGAEAGITGFQLWMDDLITWIPATGGFSTPVNLRDVRSQGIEADGGLRIQFSKKVRTRIHGSYQYTVATNLQSEFLEDAAVEKRLIYVPEHQGSAFAEVRVNTVAFRLNYRYTGSVFTTSDNEDELAGYGIVDASLLGHFEAFNSRWGWQMQALNLTDESYQVLVGRPMPMRNFRIGLTYELL